MADRWGVPVPMLRSVVTLRDIADFIAWEAENPSLLILVEAIAAILGFRWPREVRIDTKATEEAWLDWVKGSGNG